MPMHCKRLDPLQSKRTGEDPDPFMGWVARESLQYPLRDFSPPIPFVSFLSFFHSFFKRYANMTKIYIHITMSYRSYHLVFCTSNKRVTIDRHKH
jgi:hypothetical protein